MHIHSGRIIGNFESKVLAVHSQLMDISHLTYANFRNRNILETEANLKF